jgi:AhpD family alkylhydroperoxidase
MEENKTDSALQLMRDFAKIAKGTTAHIQKMRQDVIYSDGAVPAKFKVLSALLWSISARCEPCVRWYAQRAASDGVSEQELGEFLAIASTMGGCVGEMWALKAYEAFRSPRGSEAEQETCCR